MRMPDWVYRNIGLHTNTLIPKETARRYTQEQIKNHLEKVYKCKFKIWESDGLTYVERVF